MTKPAGKDANANPVPPAQAAGDDPFGLAPWLKGMPDVPMHPLMAHPMAAVAATTAIGFGMAGQFAGMMLGAMQGAAERAKASMDEAAETVAKAGPAETPAVAPRRRAVKAKAAGPESPPAGETTRARPVRKASGARAARSDDLKAISGIGPKVEQVLNGMGVTHYADIAAWSASDVTRIEAELGLDGRIARDGWVEQANALVKTRG